MQTKIQVAAIGLARDGKQEWNLAVEPTLNEDDEILIHGTDSDLPTLKKLLGKTFDARLSIGAEDDVAGVDQVKAELDKAIAHGAELERQLAESLQRLEKQIDKVAPAAPQVLDVNHPVVKAMRGALQVVKENAKAFADLAKGSDSAKYLSLHTKANEGLAKLDELVPPPKKNGGELKLVEKPAPAAS